MKPVLIIAAFLVLAVVLSAGCSAPQPAAVPATVADKLVIQAEEEFAHANYRTAASLFTFARENYTLAGDTAAALKARDRAFTSGRMFIEFPYNRTAVEQHVAAAFPLASASEIAGWLDGNMTVSLMTDGEILYFTDTVSNIRFHNLDLMQEMTAGRNYTPLYDELTALTFAPPKAGAGPYGEPVVWNGVEELTVPRDELPATGMLKLWIPLPVETGPQTNVTITSVEPARYVRYSTGTTADLGLVYLEIPLEEVKDPFLNITARFRFDQHEQRFTVDPAKVKPYNTSDPEYLKYTASGTNIAITPEIKKKAQEIVGNETNPYLQAEKIYWHIMKTLPYSHAPHPYLDASGIPESTYVLETGIGDCGSQSMYFAALCRSLGIPARAPGGYQMIMGTAGTHFWAEYYLEGFGWIPVDVTAAETAGWSYNATDDERHRFREYFFGSLDPYRYIIQKDVDIPLTPDPGDAVMTRLVVQNPKAVCNTCTEDPEIMLDNYWKVTVDRV